MIGPLPHSLSQCTLICFFLSPQLLGFIYACYVISVITEEEDSCKYLSLSSYLLVLSLSVCLAVAVKQ